MSRRRLGVLLALVPLYVFFIMVVETVALRLLMIESWSWSEFAELAEFPGEMLDLLGESEFWISAGIPAVVLAVTQFLFVIPIFWIRPAHGARSKPLMVSLVTAGFMAMGLTLALLLAVGSAIQMMTDTIGYDPPTWAIILFLIAVPASWVFWSAVLFVFCRDDRTERVLTRAMGVLLGGTIVEVLVTLPIDVMIRRRSDCYCGEGSFVALLFSTWAILWLAGPGILLAVYSKRHRLWRDRHCARCGYAKGPSPGERCPECGFDWRTRA